MICAGRGCVYAIFFGVFVCAQSFAVFGKDGKESKDLKSQDPLATATTANAVTKFQWSEHSKLSWDDFRGQADAVIDECAAVTHCGIGFTSNSTCPGSKPVIKVYNNFYINKSWVRPDAKMPQILEHEQGHFDLCEIYTRKLRDRMSNFDANTTDIKQSLMNIYNEISQEYETRQQAYERETTHGTNIPEQKKWVDIISQELQATI